MCQALAFVVMLPTTQKASVVDLLLENNEMKKFLSIGRNGDAGRASASLDMSVGKTLPRKDSDIRVVSSNSNSFKSSIQTSSTIRTS